MIQPKSPDFRQPALIFSKIWIAFEENIVARIPHHKEFLLKNYDTGVRFAEIRKDMGMTQEEFAELLEVSRYTIIRAEKGEDVLKLRHFKKLSQMNYSIDWLLTGRGSIRLNATREKGKSYTDINKLLAENEDLNAQISDLVYQYKYKGERNRLISALLDIVKILIQGMEGN